MAKKRNNLAVGAVIAAGVGYVAGVLTAPKSGKDTRKDLQNSALKAKKEAEDKLKELHSDLSDLITKGTKQAGNMTDKAKQELHEALAKAERAKNKTRQLLSAIHEGEAGDKNLQKAIEEVKKATKHLKSFVSEDVKPKTKKASK